MTRNTETNAWTHLAEAMPDNRNNVIANHRIRKHAMREVLPTYGMRPDTEALRGEEKDSRDIVRETEFEKAHRAAREDLKDLFTFGATASAVGLVIATLKLLVG